MKFELSPETGKHNLLWMIGEIGEVIDIVKKYGDIEPTNDVELRNHLVEEMADVLMHYNNVISQFNIIRWLYVSVFFEIGRASCRERVYVLV